MELMEWHFPHFSICSINLRGSLWGELNTYMTMMFLWIYPTTKTAIATNVRHPPLCLSTTNNSKRSIFFAHLFPYFSFSLCLYHFCCWTFFVIFYCFFTLVSVVWFHILFFIFLFKHLFTAGGTPLCYLGLEHVNKTQRRSRFNYLEKAIKIYNWIVSRRDEMCQNKI